MDAPKEIPENEQNEHASIKPEWNGDDHSNQGSVNRKHDFQGPILWFLSSLQSELFFTIHYL